MIDDYDRVGDIHDRGSGDFEWEWSSLLVICCCGDGGDDFHGHGTMITLGMMSVMFLTAIRIVMVRMITTVMGT